VTPAALPWRTDLFTGRAVLVAGPAGPFGPAAAKTWRALGGQAIESPGGDAPAADDDAPGDGSEEDVGTRDEPASST